MVVSNNASSTVSVSDAVDSRRTIRQFLDKPVTKADVEDILVKAQRAPSGGNLQPWKVYVVAGEARDELVNIVMEKRKTNPIGDGSEYDIYPPELKDPYRTRRRICGQQLYETIGIGREDRTAKFAQLERNFSFFGAPVGLFFTIDRQMGLGQWADMGMFMQNVMLLAIEKGLATCPQEAWAVWYKTISDYVAIPDEEMLFCGMGLGYADPSAQVNTFVTERGGLEEFAVLKGF
ncbi:MAG: nitroreductase [Pseudomonadales bacterium]|nr:nitroreductase [Pseudomonadales bacterium]